MGDAKFQQEFECSFVGNIQGSIYGDLVDDLDDAKRIGSVPYDPAHLVHTAWDLGYTDACSIIFFQQISHNIHIIDYYENEKEALPHYAELLKDIQFKDKWYRLIKKFNENYNTVQTKTSTGFGSQRIR